MQIVDIHTHKLISEIDIIAVRNVTLEYANTITKENSDLLSVGIHPWEIDNYTENDLELLQEVAANNNVKLIGECGLDKNISTSYEWQLNFFKKQIAISEKLQKPLIIHCVGYYNELFQLRNKLKPTQQWIIHSFRGKPQLASQALKLGFDLSYGEKYNTDSVKITPLKNLFIETDESQIHIEKIYQNIANIKNCTINKLAAGYELLKNN